ncbi:histidine kinase N-terminal 7TM domain-containing protein [Pelotomaculum sp. PtaB.Bin117]|uniref:sensor histidine kinase n=1 Tax=Pelotomaculum sp. PtaB.Bin117 TaxID=1811694 RepID=UPI0009D28FA0|nr:histidine kinase N-terminal 7TM domain-containing protein [Pelotomaculum sp. PtaB.Bin117]OPX88257.1 MAG: Sensor histidine kinase LiaS [Pelotomaculum sp. PtaB.Bin117]OPY63520.1 MAG: Sensor histidine kinase LiaS [Pelotomaculum sp. PtaU1.Bin065]
MHYQYNPYIWPLIVSACASMSLGIFALLRRRDVKGAKSFMRSMFVVTIWSAGNTLEMASLDFSTKLFWANMQYFAYCYSPVTLLALCMEFTGYDRWVKNKKVLWFAVLPTIIILLVWTDPLHGLIRYDMHMDYSGSFPVIAKKYGPLFFIHALYSHFLNIFAWILLVRAVFFKSTVYRKQAAALLLGISLIIIPNILYISGRSPVQRFDLTPVFFGPAGLIVAWAIFRYKLFDVVPVARATVIETMNAGVMVLDLRNRVLDTNPAFAEMVGMSASAASTRQVEEVCKKIPELLYICTEKNVAPSEFSGSVNGHSKVYEAWLSPLTDNRGVLIGRLVVAYDITEKKLAQQEYLKQQWKLAVTEERERLARDLHDNLGQVLGFINFQAEGIRQELLNAEVEIAATELGKLVEVTQAAHNEIRKYIRQARNAESIDENFVAALSKDISGFEKQTGLRVKLNIPFGFTGEGLKPQVRINVLNIVKEALNNVRKHAGAGKVKVSFALAREQLCVAVEDDGKGFDIQKPVKDMRNKFGLNIMRERALEIGAQLEIKSIEGKGSRIALCVPVSEGESGNAGESDAGR